jgi:hypothetical protein
VGNVTKGPTLLLFMVEILNGATDLRGVEATCQADAPWMADLNEVGVL